MSIDIQSDSTWKDEFVTAAARAFFTLAYADFVEEDEREDDGFDYPRPGCQQDWMDYAPEPPIAAYVLAGQLWEGLEILNKASVYGLARAASIADGAPDNPSDYDYVAADATDFGHDLAMEAMGTGVSWFDDHKWFDLKVPDIECSQCSFDYTAYRGE